MPHGYIQFWILGDFYLIHNSDFVLFACVGNVKVDTWLEFLSQTLYIQHDNSLR